MDEQQKTSNPPQGATPQSAAPQDKPQSTPPQDTAVPQDAAPKSEEELNTLKDELEETQKKLLEMTSITQRALADLQNFRRQAEQERVSYVSYANMELFIELLPVIENMNRALAHEPKDAEWIKGAEQSMKQLLQALEKKDLHTIEAVGKKFDPKIHEALMVGPGEKDLVLEEFEKGYLLGDKVLKRSRVKVGNGEKAAA
jgi:molecular chaperone GrpE